MIEKVIMGIFYIKKRINKVSTMVKGIDCSFTYIYKVLKKLVEKNYLKKEKMENDEGKYYISRHSYSITEKGKEYYKNILDQIK